MEVLSTGQIRHIGSLVMLLLIELGLCFGRGIPEGFGRAGSFEYRRLAAGLVTQREAEAR